MKNPLRRILAFIFAVFFGVTVHAQNLDIIGVTLLRAVTTNLTGAGIRVAQPEAETSTNPPTWEVNPANSLVKQPVDLFTYTSDAGSSSAYTNSLGAESGHADSVAGNFYGLPGGVATNVAHVDNYEADYFYNSIIAAEMPVDIGDSIVNQSFTFGSLDATNQEIVDSDYDNYAAQYNTLFVSAANNYDNSTIVCAPGTSYNCISVGAYANSTYCNSLGPTIDNGRCKPDITAPSTATSFSTPQVAGAAAVLMQAGLRGDGGSDTNSAADMRTIKALLLNGAIKPADWTNDAPSPLDYRYGAGVLNIFNSYEQLAGGKNNFISTATVSPGDAHPPDGASGAITNLSGWDFNTISSGTYADRINNYYFDVSNDAASAPFTATATLVWNRQQNEKDINNLDLFLYNCANSNLVACSTSLVDNVEHIWLPQLPQGRYDLQVLKNGGTNTVSDNETYALAWEFFSMPLNIARSGTNAALTWPIYPAGFVLEFTTNLAAPAVWSTNDIPPPTVTNGQNYILLNATNANEFFRLRRP
ncbi:MAG: S8 family serine peptidase [Limisphaerales bacterium]